MRSLSRADEEPGSRSKFLSFDRPAWVSAVETLIMSFRTVPMRTVGAASLAGDAFSPG